MGFWNRGWVGGGREEGEEGQTGQESHGKMQGNPKQGREKTGRKWEKPRNNTAQSVVNFESRGLTNPGHDTGARRQNVTKYMPLEYE